MDNNIEIKLLANRRFIYSNRKQNIIITAENKATSICVLFPDSYEEYSKRVDFVNSHGKEWTEALYIPEYKEYAGDFSKSRFTLTLPSAVTTEGELKMQFLAYKPDNSMTAVPFEVITIDVLGGVLAFKKNARSNPDLLILSYNQSTEALFKAQQAKAKAENTIETANTANTKADNAINTAEQALSISQSAEQNSQQAIATATQASQTAQTAESNINQMLVSSENAVMQADAAKGVADYAKVRADYAAERAEEAVMIATDSDTLASSAKVKADQAVHTASVSQSLVGTALTNAETAVAVATGIDAKAITALNTSQEAKTISENAETIAENTQQELEQYKSDTNIMLAGKVDKVSGKGLSSTDFTQDEKTKLSSIAEGANVNVQSDWNETSTSSDKYIKNKPTTMTASGGNADTLGGKSASDFATAAQGAKADTALQSFTESDPTVPAWAKQPSKPAYTPQEIGAATAAQGAKADTALQSFIESDPTVPAWAKQPNKPTYTPQEIGAATSAQGAKADTALQSFTETDPTVPSWAKQPSKPAYTPQEIGAATAAQGAKADTALQSFIESDPTVPAWAKVQNKPSYSFNEIAGIASAIQLPIDLLQAGANITAERNALSGQWDISAEIPLMFECNGINDNERLSNLVKGFYNSTTLADNASLKVMVHGKLGVSNTKLYGSGTFADNYRVFEFGVPDYTGNRRVFLDFSGAEVPEINTVVEAYNYFMIIYNYDIPINIHGLSLIARQTRKEGMSGSGAYLYTIKGNNYILSECDISSLNESGNGSHAVVGADCTLTNCSITVKGSNAVNYAITGDGAKVFNCKFYALSGDVYTLNSNYAFVQGCHITTIGTSTTQVQCNGKDNCTFINCTLEITGRGTLRCNSGKNCSFINCNFYAESNDINSTVSANQGSNCYFLNCNLTAKGNYWSTSGVSANSSSGCTFIACVLKAFSTRTGGYAYGSRIWNGIMIGCDLYAYTTGEDGSTAIGFSLNSAVNNKCIVIGCRFREVAETGYIQGPSILLEGTDTGGQYVIANNFIAGEIIKHTGAGENYVLNNNILGGIWS